MGLHLEAGDGQQEDKGRKRVATVTASESLPASVAVRSMREEEARTTVRQAGLLRRESGQVRTADVSRGQRHLRCTIAGE